MNMKRHSPNGAHSQDIDAGRRDVLRAGASMAALATASVGFLAAIDEAQAGTGVQALAVKIAKFERLQAIADDLTLRADDLRAQFDADLRASPVRVDWKAGGRVIYLEERGVFWDNVIASQTAADVQKATAGRPSIWQASSATDDNYASIVSKVADILSRERAGHAALRAGETEVNRRAAACGLHDAEEASDEADEAASAAFKAVLQHRHARIEEVWTLFDFLRTVSAQRQFTHSSPEQMGQLMASLSTPNGGGDA